MASPVEVRTLAEGPNGNVNGNSSEFQKGYQNVLSDPERQQKPRRSRLSSAIETFVPEWFMINMTTGTLSIILHENPYNGSWMRILSTVMFVFNILLFSLFTAITITRWILYPHSAKAQSNTVEEVGFYSCLPIAALTIIAQIALTPSQANWNGTGHVFTLLAYVLWWIAVVWMVFTTLGVLIFLTKQCGITDETMPSAPLLSNVGLASVGVVGATICNHANNVSSQLAIPIIIVGYMFVGLAVFLGLMMHALYLNKLMATGWPVPRKITSLFMLVGPFGQSTAGILFLGQAASEHFGGYKEETFLTSAAGMTVSTASIMLGLLFLGFDIFWLLFSICGLLEVVYKRQFTFVLTCWSTIFPPATTNLALIALSTALNSEAIAVLSTGWMCVLFINYFICWGFTIRDVWRGKLLNIQDEEEKRD